MDAIRIRRCQLRVRRHGGWSWGANPRQLIEQVTQRLPVWLMRILERQLANCPPDVSLAQLRLRIPVTMAELCDVPSDDQHSDGSTPRAGLTQRAEMILAAALRDVPRNAPDNSSDSARRESAGTVSQETSRTVVLDKLLDWQQAGELTRMLSTADSATLRAWAYILMDELAASAGDADERNERLAPFVRHIGAQLSDPAASASSLVRAIERVSTAARVASSTDIITHPVSSKGAEDASEASFKPSPERAASRPLFESKVHRRSDARGRTPLLRQPCRQAIAVESVLPFIVMGVLSRRKYFDALHAALVCSDMVDQSFCFAAALAYKLSPPPNRGWDRNVDTRKLAAAMCGLAEAPDNATMERFLRGLSATCAPLDASLWPSSRVVRERPGILVEQLESELWLVFDIASSQPILWCSTSQDVMRAADLLPGRLWWLAPRAAESNIIEAIAARNLRAIAFGTSPRGEGWVSAGEMLFTNEPLLRRSAAQLRRVFDQACELLIVTHSEFIELRPLVLPARGTTRLAAEFSITLAACSALGEIADTLWSEREPTEPLLALRRLADLGGTVSVEEGRVLVRPALGQRFMDLSKHGLLRDIGGVPWWPGRRVEFAGP